MVEKSNNYVFEDDLIPTVSGEKAASYELTWGDLSMKEFFMGEGHFL